ncbi:MAG: EAL domain-containing protein [Rhodospirillaceae bacterium]|nr:EAL domain-containing protein [Rhodospirillaceae bacterium]
MSVVAEGIETKEIYEAIKYLGCDMAQGYFIGKPMPGDDLAEWNDKWRKSEIFNS